MVVTKDENGNFVKDSKYNAFMSARTNLETPLGMAHNVSLLENAQYLQKNSPLVLRFGCASCKWKKTILCPFREDEFFKKHGRHSNGYCAEKIMWVKDTQQSLKKGGLASVKQVEQIQRFDEEILILRAKATELEDFYDEDPEVMKKTKAELDKLEYKILMLEDKLTLQLDKFRKQEEGTKQTIKKEITPNDINAWLKSETIDAEVVDDNTE